MKTKILVIEDDPWVTDRYQERLAEESVEIIIAQLPFEAMECYEEHKGTIDIIVMDACLSDHKPDTIPLVRHIRESGFTGHIIANSAEVLFNRELIKAGCDLWERDSNKYNVPDLIIELLKKLK